MDIFHQRRNNVSLTFIQFLYYSFLLCLYSPPLLTSINSVCHCAQHSMDTRNAESNERGLSLTAFFVLLLLLLLLESPPISGEYGYDLLPSIPSLYASPNRSNPCRNYFSTSLAVSTDQPTFPVDAIVPSRTTKSALFAFSTAMSLTIHPPRQRLLPLNPGEK